MASANELKRAVALTTRWMTEQLKECSSSPRAVRRGEKVPATDGTVCDAFDLLDSGSLSGQLSGVWLGWTELTTVRTRLFFGELVGLLLEQQLESSFGQSLCGSSGDLLEGSEIDIQARSVVAESPLGDNLCPPRCQIVKFLEFLGCKSWSGHRPVCLEVTPRAILGFPIPQAG